MTNDLPETPTGIAPPTVGGWLREFLRHCLGGLYDRSGRHHVLFFAGGPGEGR